MNSDKIETKELSILDDDGNVRIKLFVDNGQPTVILVDTAQQARIILRLATDNNTAITLCNPEGRKRLEVRLIKDVACIELNDNAQNLRAYIGVQDEPDDAVFSIHQRPEDGNKRYITRISKDGIPVGGVIDNNPA